MKHIIATIFTAAALAVAAETSITILGQQPKDIGSGKIVAVSAANKTGSNAAFTVKSVVKAGAKAYTNTVVSATVTNTITIAKSEYVLPGSVYYADGVGSTNGIIYVVIER